MRRQVAPHLYLAAVGLGDLARYREHESRTPVGPGVCPVEALEEER